MRYLLKNGVVFDVLHDRVRLDILTDGEWITAVGAGLRAPEGTAQIDLGGRLVFPGFFDAHVHVCHEPAFADAALRAWARNGVATVRDLGLLAPHALPDYLDFLRGCSRPGLARVLTAGQYIDVAGGYGSHAPGSADTIGRIVETPTQAARAVQEEAAYTASRSAWPTADRGRSAPRCRTICSPRSRGPRPRAVCGHARMC